MQYEVLNSVKFQGKLYRKGETISGDALGSELTNYLVNDGTVKLLVKTEPVMDGEAKEVTPPAPTPTPPADPVPPVEPPVGDPTPTPPDEDPAVTAARVADDLAASNEGNAPSTEGQPAQPGIVNRILHRGQE